MKWNNNGITYKRGCREVLIAQFDGTGVWYCNAPIMTQNTAKTLFRELGKYLNAKCVEVKYLIDENDTPSETEIMNFIKRYDGSYIFERTTVE